MKYAIQDKEGNLLCITKKGKYTSEDGKFTRSRLIYWSNKNKFKDTEERAIKNILSVLFHFILLKLTSNEIKPKIIKLDENK